MASEDTLIGNDWVVQLGDGSSPPVFADMCAVFDFGSIGEEKPLVDVTSICDAARKYRNGLADGLELPLQLNFIQGDTQAQALYEAYNTDTLVDIRLLIKDSSPQEYMQFQATVKAWNVAGPIGEKSTLSFTLKVSGGVTWTY